MPRKLAFMIQSPQTLSYSPRFFAICTSAGRLPTTGSVMTTITVVWIHPESLYGNRAHKYAVRQGTSVLVNAQPKEYKNA